MDGPLSVARDRRSKHHLQNLPSWFLMVTSTGRFRRRENQ